MLCWFCPIRFAQPGVLSKISCSCLFGRVCGVGFAVWGLQGQVYCVVCAESTFTGSVLIDQV